MSIKNIILLYQIQTLIYTFTSGMHGLPGRSGKLKDISRFDAAMFGVHPKQANAMDPQLRMLLEVTYEAIVDAGKNIIYWSLKKLYYMYLGLSLQKYHIISHDWITEKLFFWACLS